MNQKKLYIIMHSDEGEKLGNRILSLGIEGVLFRSPNNFEELWKESNAFLFIGAMGICVRTIAPYLKDKFTDPAVINMDTKARFIQSVLSGHVGGANELTIDLSNKIGAQPVITTVSDCNKLWSLDTLANRFNWKMECHHSLTGITAAFVNRRPTALLLEARDEGALFLETSLPDHVKVFYTTIEIDESKFDIIIAVSPFIHEFRKPVLYYRPAMLCLGLGCQKGIDSRLFSTQVSRLLNNNKLSVLALRHVGTVDIKSDEHALIQFADVINLPLQTFGGGILSQYDIPNPSNKVESVTGSKGVAEAVAMHLSKNELYLEKTKEQVEDKFFTMAIAIEKSMERKGMVEIVGAGPGDPELVSVRGKRFLQTADLILYAGSLVPKELTHYAKSGCVVKSSAGMDLETQIETMKSFYDRGLFIVRLHTGDPCIYGAIQEQMARMDELNMQYHITPGISSFQAAAAALQSQFTIPEEVQSIILTRGEGLTPMPEKEQLHKLAQSQSTMCIYLSASIADKVQDELLVHYPSDTPVAVCYKLSWKDEKIWKTTLSQLAQTIEENNLSMTTMIVVGKAIGNRSGESKLYHHQFTHAFRKGLEVKE